MKFASPNTVDPRYLDLLILNNRLSWSENLVSVLTWKWNNRLQNIVEKRTNSSKGAISPLFHNIFNISLNSGVKLFITHLFAKCGCSIYFSSIRKSDITGTDNSKYFRESLGLQDYKSRLYLE